MVKRTPVLQRLSSFLLTSLVNILLSLRFSFLEVRCKPITPPRDGEASWKSSDGRRENYTFGSESVAFRTLYFECRGKLELIGKSSITCLANGNWSGSVPICSSKESVAHYISLTRRKRIHIDPRGTLGI